jgi:hypothetical protein
MLVEQVEGENLDLPILTPLGNDGGGAIDGKLADE